MRCHDVLINLLALKISLPANSEWAGVCGAGNACVRTLFARDLSPATYGQAALLRKHTICYVKIQRNFCKSER